MSGLQVLETVASNCVGGAPALGDCKLSFLSCIHSVANTYCQWRLYVGIISSIQPPGQRKIKNVPDPEEEDSEDEDINMADGKPQEQTVMMVEEESDRQKIEDERRIEAAKRERERAKEDARQQQRERREEMKDARMVHFFNETEDAVKIFFSAFFRDKGYIWCISII